MRSTKTAEEQPQETFDGEVIELFELIKPMPLETVRDAFFKYLQEYAKNL